MPRRQTKRGKTFGGKPFNSRRVMNVLRNKANIGIVEWADVTTAGAHEPIIAAELLASKTVFRATLDLPLLGVAAGDFHCGDCLNFVVNDDEGDTRKDWLPEGMADQPLAPAKHW